VAVGSGRPECCVHRRRLYEREIDRTPLLPDLGDGSNSILAIRRRDGDFDAHPLQAWRYAVEAEKSARVGLATHMGFDGVDPPG